MKILFTISFILLASIANAVEVTSTNLEKENLNWSTEATFNTISNSTTSTFGPSLLYKLGEISQIGFRLLAPVGAAENQGTTSFSAVYRAHFNQKVTHLFGELTLGMNVYGMNSGSHGSFGTNLGIIHHFNSDFAIGGISGFEWGLSNVDSKGYLTSAIPAWGRIGVFTALNF